MKSKKKSESAIRNSFTRVWNRIFCEKEVFCLECLFKLLSSLSSRQTNSRLCIQN